MRKEIKIGEKSVDLEINALTPILYKRTFKEDMIVVLDGMRGGKNKDKLSEFFPQLAYIGACQAKKEKPSEDAFEEWVCEFGALDFMVSSPQIMELVNNQRVTTSAQKN